MITNNILLEKINNFIKEIIKYNDINDIINNYNNDINIIILRIWDIIIKFGFCSIFPNTIYDHLIENNNNLIILKSYDKYLNEKVNCNFSTIFLQHKRLKKSIIIISKINKDNNYNLENILKLINEDCNIYILIQEEKNNFLNKIYNNNNNKLIKDIINKDNILDLLDMNSFFKKFKEDILKNLKINNNINYDKLYLSEFYYKYMFLVDKYNVKTIDDIILHKNLYNNLIIGANYKNKLHNLEILNNIIIEKKYDEIIKFHYKKSEIYKNYKLLPNLLIHGNSGSGKHTLIKLLLTDIFDESINDTFMETYLIKGYGNSIVEVDIEQSKYHLIFEPKNSGIDKYIIQEVIKEYAKKKIINISYNIYPYHIVFINNIDNLNENAQTSLRDIIENYSKTCRFILCGSQTSKIIDPIKSRCLDFKVKSPTFDEMKFYLYNILNKENIKISNLKINKIIKDGELNIKKTLWLLQMTLYGIKNLELSWKESLNIIVTIIINFKNLNTNILKEDIVTIIREVLYKIFTTTISGSCILHELLNKIIYSNEFNTTILNEILQVASNSELRLYSGKRCVFHLEDFIYKIYIIIYKYFKKN